MTFFEKLFGKNSEAQTIAQPDADRGENDSVTIQSDRPIESMTDDKFDRAPFARQVAKIVSERRDTSSLVVGVYGPWGDGKTSTLAMIKEALAASPDVVTLDYNPWFYGSSTEIITRTFFKSLRDRLQKTGWFSKEKIGDLMAKMGKSIPQIGDTVSSYGEALSTEELATTRDKIGEILKKHGKRMVIFVDDIDRLDRADIQTLFKLVRLSGSFDHTTYILAFDDDIVSEALGEAYGSGDSVAGRRFLEKIVQVPLHLPPASSDKLRTMMFESCDRVLRENAIELPHGQSFEIGNGLVGGFLETIRTPRQVNLFDNAITFAVPILKDEVRVPDQILIEGLRVFYPSVYQAVRSCPDEVLKQPDRPAVGELAVRGVDHAIDSLAVSERARQGARSLLKQLFPRLGRMGYGDEWDAIWAREKRVCSRDYFNRYFTYAIPQGDISDQTIQAIVDHAQRAQGEELGDLLDGVFADASELLIRKLRTGEDAVPLAAVPALVRGITARADRIRFSNDLFLGDWNFSQAAILVTHLLRRLSEADQDAQLEAIFQTCPSLPFLVQIVRFSVRDEGREHRGFLAPARIFPLIAILLRRFIALDRATIFDTDWGGFARIAYCIERHGDPQVRAALTQFIQDLLEAAPENAGRLLRAFSGRTQSDDGVISPGDFRRDTYNAMRDLVDVDALYQRLRGIYGPALDAAEWQHERAGEDVDRRLAFQFAAVHRNPRPDGEGEDA